MEISKGEEPLLTVHNLVKEFPVKAGLRGTKATLRALDDVSFTLMKGETLGVVGESGCGKSTLARTLLRLVEPTSGEVVFEGRSLTGLNASDLRESRRQIQMVFQDPYASLHPKHTVGSLISETWKIHHGVVPVKDRPAAVRKLLSDVGLPERYVSAYPTQLSGGERQRVAIARALSLKPHLLILDEPVSSLDVSIQAQIIQLLMNLQVEYELSYIFISHDLSLVRLVADQMIVMYMGRIIEAGSTEDVYNHPSHPYTRALLAASPNVVNATLNPPDYVMDTEVGSPLMDLSGCRFRARCWKAQAICQLSEPQLEAHSKVGHMAACHFASDSDV